MVSRETLPDWLGPAEPGLRLFAALLADVGVTRGLIGPREVPRLWERHLLNCAVVADPAEGLIRPGDRIADVGSGAGLPGLVWALARPDVTVALIEPLLRRATFLGEAVEQLAIGDRVVVLRARAEEVARDADWVPASVVTARAVAPLDRLLGWTVPLLGPQGRLVTLKGASAAQECADAADQATRLGLAELQVRTCGGGVVDPPTTVITAVRRAAQ